MSDFNIVFDGDSITAGTTTTGYDYPHMVAVALRGLGYTVDYANLGVSSQTLANMESDAAEQVDALYDAGDTHNTVVCWGGINDIYNDASAATVESRLSTYCSNRQAAGWKVVVLTIIPAASVTEGKETIRQAVNVWIRANYGDFAESLRDIASDALFDTLDDVTNTTYYQGDGIHPTRIGNAYIAALVQATIQTLTGTTGTSSTGTLRRTVRGLLGRDDFGADTKADYYAAFGATTNWSVSGGAFAYAAAPDAESAVHRIAPHGSKCVTVKTHLTAFATLYAPIIIVNDYVSDNYSAGYWIRQYATTAKLSKRPVIGSFSDLDSWAFSVSNGNNYVHRLYIASGTLYGLAGTTALSAGADVADATFTEGWPGFYGYGDSEWDYVESRSSHLITCSGLPASSSVVASDGTTTATANTADGAVSIDAGAVLFPLASLTVYSQADGAGDVLASLDTGDLDDMGGGDAFEYSGAAAGNPYWYYQMLARRR